MIFSSLKKHKTNNKNNKKTITGHSGSMPHAQQLTLQQQQQQLAMQATFPKVRI